MWIGLRAELFCALQQVELAKGLDVLQYAVAHSSYFQEMNASQCNCSESNDKTQTHC